MSGYQKARLESYLSGAKEKAVKDTANDWKRCASVLSIISTALADASPKMKEEIGGKTGPAVDAEFTKAAETMKLRAETLTAGSAKLESVAQVMADAREVKDTMKDIEPPTKPTRTPGSSTADEETAQQTYDTDHGIYLAQVDAQEAKAEKWANAMNTDFQDAIPAMRAISGYEPPPP
nr:hypothetical protein [Nocardioides sp.]